MIPSYHLRALALRRTAGLWLMCCLASGALAATCHAQAAESSGSPATQAQAPQIAAAIADSQPKPSKRQAREAESVYLAGAKKLERNDLDAAEADFQRALTLDPANRNYALAISIAREHRVSELVRRATQARQAGDEKSAGALLEQARAIDPQNTLVLEHSGPFVAMTPTVPQAVAQALGRASGGAAMAPLTDRSRMITPLPEATPWKIEAPVLAGAVRLEPAPSKQDFHLRGSSTDVIRNVASAFGINAAVDDSVEQKQLRFDLAGVTYEQAMSAVLEMSHSFAVPVDATTVIVAKDDDSNRKRLERLLEETINLPGMATDQINELAQVVKSVFDIKQAAISTGLGNIVVRAPQDVLGPLNETLRELVESSGEVMIEVKLYEIDKTHMTNAGATIPTEFNVFNVDQAATSVVNANQALVQQAVAEGLVPAGTSNLQIALALIASGLVQNSLASNLIGVIGGGVFQTGISGSSSATINLSLNSSDTRTLDDVQLRVGDRQAATFREGNRYPITQSTYSSGISTAASAVGNQTINGVPISSLLQQYAGGTSVTIPQVTYEDLGITLKATPVIEKSGRIRLTLDLKIEALSGTSLDGNPVLNSRQFSTGMTVANGESALLVSNVSKTETAAMTGLPGLSELPGFQIPLEDTVEHDQSQLVVVVTPRIVRRRPDLIEGPRIPTPPLTDD